VEGRALVASVEDVELLDSNASAEQLLYRLFHERGVRVFRSRDLHAQCSCSRERVERMLRSFSQDDRDHMVENGKITVTCEFCNSTYLFEPLDVREPTPSSGQRVPQNGMVRASRRLRPAAALPPSRPQLIDRSRCGVSSEKAGISMSNSSPAAVTMP